MANIPPHTRASIMELANIKAVSASWEWAGCRTDQGYGRVVFGGMTWKAHRLVYTLIVGEIPAGLSLDHLCRNRICVNPAHLEPVTHKENTLRGLGVSVINSRKTECANGHPYTPENTLGCDGRRRCRTCAVLNTRRSVAKNGLRYRLVGGWKYLSPEQARTDRNVSQTL